MKRKNNKLRTLAMAAVLVLPGMALGQSISVVINGEPLMFSGVGARQVNGRVMVPLRGIMEKLGAYVGWQPATRTVTASKSGVDLTLTLGDRRAIVNGRDVMLDVPAQEISGSTMVPLRFVGEALGAEVRWNAATYTVDITTAAGTTTDPNSYIPPKNNPPTTPPAGKVSITSFDVDHSGTIRGGEELRLTLIGTPGGEATFSIPGVIQDVQMTERESGVYTGSFRVPANSPINISKANAVARLRIGTIERMIQSGTSLGFDTQAPMVTTVTPDPGTRVTRDRPNISATFDDASGSGVDPATVEVRLDNRVITQDAQVTSTFVSYRPDRALSGGTHEVSITARDRAGNPVSKTWSFRVMNNADVIRSFNIDSGGQEILPGSEVTFTLLGEPGGKATFTVGDRIVDRRMREVEPGKYVGNYVVRRNDNFEDTAVTAKLVTASGETFTQEAQTRFNARVRTLEAPTFTEPADEAKVGNTVVLRGTAAPGSRIHIKIDYTKTTLGIFKMNGTLGEYDVTADDRGRWQTDSIDLATGLGGGATTFNVTAVTVGSNGKQSSVSKLTLKK